MSFDFQIPPLHGGVAAATAYTFVPYTFHSRVSQMPPLGALAHCAPLAAHRAPGRAPPLSRSPRSLRVAGPRRLCAPPRGSTRVGEGLELGQKAEWIQGYDKTHIVVVNQYGFLDGLEAQKGHIRDWIQRRGLPPS